MVAKNLQKQALKLKPIERLRLVQMILESFDRSDSLVEKAWVAESEVRYAAYKEGRLKPVGFNRER